MTDLESDVEPVKGFAAPLFQDNDDVQSINTSQSSGTNVSLGGSYQEGIDSNERQIPLSMGLDKVCIARTHNQMHVPTNAIQNTISKKKKRSSHQLERPLKSVCE